METIANGASRATTILSPSKFPAGTKAVPFTPCLAGMPYARQAQFMGEELPPRAGDSSAVDMFLEESLQDSTKPGMRAGTLSAIVDSRLSQRPEDVAAHADVPKGLGPLPEAVASVSSTLLFNSTQVPYQDYAKLDNLVQTAEEETKDDDGPADGIGAAPQTLFEGNDLPAVAGFDLTYKPAAPAVQALQLPESMALPNIADVAWTDTRQDGAGLGDLLPSALRASGPALPAIEDYAPAAPPLPAPAAAAPAASVAAQVAPPPPPTPAPPSGAPAAAPVSAPVTAPPPPMNPPPAPAPAPKLPDGVPAPDAGRNDLLAALRNPENMARLKRKKEAEAASKERAGAGGPQRTAAPRPAPPPNPQDELAKKIAARRRALEGTQRDAPTDRGKQRRPTITAVPMRALTAARGLPSLSEKEEDEEEGDGGDAGAGPASSRASAAASLSAMLAGRTGGAVAPLPVATGAGGDDGGDDGGSDSDGDSSGFEEEDFEDAREAAATDSAAVPRTLSLAELMGKPAATGVPLAAATASPNGGGKPASGSFQMDLTRVHGFKVATASVVSGGAGAGADDINDPDGGDAWDD